MIGPLGSPAHLVSAPESDPRATDEIRHEPRTDFRMPGFSFTAAVNTLGSLRAGETIMRYVTTGDATKRLSSILRERLGKPAIAMTLPIAMLLMGSTAYAAPLSFDVVGSGFNDGGGSATGTYTVDDANADGVADPSEVVSWSFTTTGFADPNFNFSVSNTGLGPLQLGRIAVPGGMPPTTGSQQFASFQNDTTAVPSPLYIQDVTIWGTGAIYLYYREGGGYVFDQGTYTVSASAPPDTDGDGVPDDEDNCPNSDLSPTVVIDGCDSGVDNGLSAVGPDGCTISDLIAECAEDAKNHGKFVSCVAALTNDLRKAGQISGKEKGAIQRCAAQSTLP